MRTILKQAQESLTKITLFFCALIFTLSWLSPFGLYPWTTFHQESFAFIGLSILLSITSIGLIKYWSATRYIILISFISIIPSIQSSFGITSKAADPAVITAYILSFCAAAFLGYNLQSSRVAISGKPWLSWVAYTVLISATASCFISILQWSGLSSKIDPAWIASPPEGSRPFANMRQPNNLATFIGFGLASLFFLFEKNAITSKKATTLVVILIIGLALCQTRASWLFMTALPMFIFWQKTKKELKIKNKTVLFITLFFIITTISFPKISELLGFPYEPLLERAKHIERWAMYKDSIKVILNSPWYGYGWNQAMAAQASIATQSPMLYSSTYSHNILLDLLIWNGPVIGSAIVVLSAFWLLNLIKNITSLESCYAWCALIPFIIHSFVELPYAYSFLLIPAGLFIGAAEGDKTKATDKIKKIPRLAIFTVGILGITATLIAWREFITTESEYWKAFSYKEDKFIPREEQKTDTNKILTGLAEQINFLYLPISNNYTEDQINELISLTKERPGKFELFKASNILIIHGKIDQAYNLMLIYRGLYPEKFNETLKFMKEESLKNENYLKILYRFNQVHEDKITSKNH